MALSFIGKPISLISHSDVRYRGILAGIDPNASTIQLSNVYSMGTETRRPPAEFIPPVQEPYQYIIFRASEVKDLAVDEPAPRRNVHDDPAVLGASAPMAAPYAPYAPPVAPPPVPQAPQPPVQTQQQYGRPPPPTQHPSQLPQLPQQQAALPGAPPQPIPHPQQQQQQLAPPTASTAAAAQQQPSPSGRQQQGQNNNRRHNNSVHSAAVSLETVERAIGDLRVSTNTVAVPVSNATPGTGSRSGRRSGRRGGDQHQSAGTTEAITVPATDFDFESSNARFDKAAVAASAISSKANSTINEEDDRADTSETEGSPDARDKQAPVAYNPSKSFFDSLSSSAHPSTSADGAAANGAVNVGSAPGTGGRGRRGRGGGSAGRSRREEERERNVATFGEPGGVGLLGPGAYVGGWGGYGGHGVPSGRGNTRRSGRPRRSGQPNAGTSQAVVPARG